jgi:hypothetical protein
MPTPRRRRIDLPAERLRHGEGVGTSSPPRKLARSIRLPPAGLVLERKDSDPPESPAHPPPYVARKNSLSRRRNPLNAILVIEATRNRSPCKSQQPMRSTLGVCPPVMTALRQAFSPGDCTGGRRMWKAEKRLRILLTQSPQSLRVAGYRLIGYSQPAMNTRGGDDRMPWRRKTVGALAAGFFLIYLIALAPHLVHHLLDEDHDSPSCPFLALSQHTPGLQPDPPTLTCPTLAEVLDEQGPTLSFPAPLIHASHPRGPPPSVPSI